MEKRSDESYRREHEGNCLKRQTFIIWVEIVALEGRGAFTLRKVSGEDNFEDDGPAEHPLLGVSWILKYD